MTELFNFFKRKTIEPTGLKKAKEENLISEEEYWLLKKRRAEEKLKELKVLTKNKGGVRGGVL